MIDLSVDLGKGLKLRNPVMLASGTAAYGLEFEDFYSLDRIGSVVTKGISMTPIQGNPVPRIVETSGGMINSIGLQNVGAEKFMHDYLPELRKRDVVYVANVFGYSLQEYLDVVEFLDRAEGIDGFEVNISCPNVKKGGIQFGTNPDMTGKLIASLRKITDKHLMVKLSPNVTDITEFAKISESEGADSISLINTLLGMAVDIHTQRPVIARIMGGYSGPPIKPVALRMVYQVSKAVSIPVIGMGGIETTEDALEFMMVGASAVQLGTVNFYNPSIGGMMADQIADFLDKKGLVNIDQWIGSFKDDKNESGGCGTGCAR